MGIEGRPPLLTAPVLAPERGRPAVRERSSDASAATRATAGTDDRKAPRADRASLRLGYQPALDGIRGLALLVVLAFHAGAEWLPGSYLAVSAFFTLSGFLITRLLVEEKYRTGTIHSGKFYGRRIRRLVPASSITLLAVVVLGYFGVFEHVADLRRELVGAALQTSNWVRLTSGSSYTDLFQDGVSPVEHFWSLAVEEQFYLLWPLIFVVASRRSRDRASGTVIWLFVMAALVAPAVALVWGPEADYLATPARVGEILSGCALALVYDWRRPPSWMSKAAPLAAISTVLLILTTPFDHGWAYVGGLPLFSLLSCLVVAGALIDGSVRTVLSWRGFVVLGTMSYGVYLVHWPVFVIADTHWQGLGPVGLVGAKLAVTFAVAAGLFVLVERPLRRAPPRRGAAVSLVAGLASVGILAAAVIPGPNVLAWATPSAMAEAVDLQPVSGALPPLVEGGVQRRPVRIMLVGDSTGASLGDGLVRWAFRRQDGAQVRSAAVLGCGLVRGGRTDNLTDMTRGDCERAIGTDVPRAMARLRPDVVVVVISGADAFPRAWDHGPLQSITDPEHARHLAQDYRAFFEVARAAGVAHVVWTRPPVYGDPPDASFHDGGQAFIEQVVRDEAERRPGVVSILDYRTWFEAQGLGVRPVRPDGVHLYPGVADQVAADYLGPALRDLALGR